jgi:hypothetical protein
MRNRLTAPGGEEHFSVGVRRWRPLATSVDVIQLAQLDWSVARPALDRVGRLVRVMEVPTWRRGDVERLLLQASTSSARFDVAADAMPAPELLVGSGIDVDGAAYRMTPAGQAIRWEFSPSLDQLRGRLCMAQCVDARSDKFARYLLHLNWDLRFIRIGYAGSDIALQAVLPDRDRRWVELAEGAFTTLCDVLRSQAAWWHQPRWLVDDLFRQVDRGPKKERSSE